MKKIVLIISLFCFITSGEKAKAQFLFNNDNSNTDCTPANNVWDGRTQDLVRSIGIGKFSPNPSANGTRARLHVRNDILFQSGSSTCFMEGKLFRTDGNDKVDNSWTMWTHPFGGPYSEIYKIQVPQLLPFTMELQATHKSGDIRFNTSGANFRGIIDVNGRYGINTSAPNNRLEITSASIDPYWPSTTPGGSSGLMFTNLTSAATPLANPGKGVLSVDNFGNVIYVPASGGPSTATVCAQNGLNHTVGAPCVEMGGNLIRPTNVTFNGWNQCWNTFGGGNGQFAVTDYASGLNSSATTMPGLRYLTGIFTKTNQFGLEVQNIKTGTPPINTQGGIEVTVDLDNNGNLNTHGLGSSVISNGANTFGILNSARARTPLGLLNVYGISSSGSDAAHSYGGVFSAATPVSPSGNTWAHGVDMVASGGFVEAMGAYIQAFDCPNANIGIQTMAYGNTATNPRNCYGVYSLASDKNSQFNSGVVSLANGSLKSYGVIGGVAQNITMYSLLGNAQVGVLGFDPLGSFTNANPPVGNCHIGTAGVIGGFFGNVGQPIPGTNTGLYGRSTFGTTGPGNMWAAFFDGDINLNGGAYQFLSPVTFSDKSLKKNIKPIENALDVLLKLSPKSYEMTTENCKQLNLTRSKTQFGLIAQEVEQVIPEIVYETKVAAYYNDKGEVVHPEKDVKGVSYEQLISYLIKGTQEQQTQIQKQEAAIAAQQQQIEELKALVKSIAGVNNANSNSQSIEVTDKNVIVLDQNVPNPFAESTVINYNIPNDFTKAQIIFSTTEGTIIKTVDITQKGNGKLNIFANDLTNGLYVYSLVVDGKVIDTKKMVKGN